MTAQMTYPFYDGLGTPDEKRELKQEFPKDLEGLLGKFEEILLDESSKSAYEKNKKYTKESIDQILTPERINMFLQQTIKYEDHNEYSEYIGYFISQLIQNSYSAGHNNFTINTIALKEIGCLGYGLAGTKEKPIEVNINGNAGERCGNHANYSTFNIKGNARYGCGSSAIHSTFNIEGNAGDWCGSSAIHSTFNIKGNAGDWCGFGAKNCHIIFRGKVGDRSLFETNSIVEFYDKIIRMRRPPGRLPFLNGSTYIAYEKDVYMNLIDELSRYSCHLRECRALLKDQGGNIIEDRNNKGQTFYDLSIEDIEAISGKKQQYKVDVSKDLEELLEKFRESLEILYGDGLSAFEILAYKKEIGTSINNLLTPEQINMFLQQTRKYEDHGRYSMYTGTFITQLIQNSYEAGHNDFTIDTIGLKALHLIGCRLIGTSEEPIKVKIIGNPGEGCGWFIRNCKIEIIGNAGRGCGERAVNSTFAVYNKNLYERLLRNINLTNKIKLKDQNGNILEERE